MRNIALLAANTLRLLSKRSASIVFYILLPLIGVLLVSIINGGAASPSIRVGVVDEDAGRFSRELATRIGEWGGFTVRPTTRDALNALITGDSLDCGVIVPAGYSESVLRGAAEPIRLISIKGQAATAWLERFIDIYSRNLSDALRAAGGDPAGFEEMQAAFHAKGARLVVEDVRDESRARGVALSSIGILIMFLMLGAGISTQVVLDERRMRTFQRICAAPVSPRQFIMGNGSAAFIVIIVQVVAVQIFMKLPLRLDTRIPDLVLAAILLAFGCASISMGFLVAAFSKSSAMSSALNALVLVPTCMLGGCLWSVDAMPVFMQRLALFTPQRWVLDAAAKAQSGAGFVQVGGDVLVILSFALAFISVAAYRFSRLEGSGSFA